MFIAEAVTLAHVARPAALAASLDPGVVDITFACDPRYRKFVELTDGEFLSIEGIGSDRFSDRLSRGAPVFQASELHDYVRADMAAIKEACPDLIVGDFRLSLSVSARLMSVPYACITNSYWSPFARDQSLPLPVLPWTRHAPIGLAQKAFDLVQSLAVKPHCRALNAVRAAYGLPRLESLRSIYTDADHVLYADHPDWFPLDDPPPNHHHLGPIAWSPPVALPTWWNELPFGQPLLYVTMGSSGSTQALELVLDSVAALDVVVMVATVGANLKSGRWPNVWCADYLPGAEAASRAAVVICNGGSPTSQQALAAGKPVIGICRNMDQLLNMRGLVTANRELTHVGLRADKLTRRQIQSAVVSALARKGPGPSALTPRSSPCSPEFGARFRQFLEDFQYSVV